MQNTIIMNMHSNPSNMDIESILDKVFNALVAKGYKPIEQLTHYLVTSEPLYITGYDNARVLIQKVDRYTILEYLLNKNFAKEK